MAAKLAPEFLFHYDSIARRFAAFLSPEDWKNCSLVCWQWCEDLSQPFLLKDSVARAKDSLFLMLVYWVRKQYYQPSMKGKEELILSARSNWKDLHKKFSMPKVKAIICLADSFLQIDDNEYWFYECFRSMLKLWTTLEYSRSFVLLLAARTGQLEIIKALVIIMPVEELMRAKAWQNMTALHFAANHGHLETVLALVDRMPQDALIARECEMRRNTALHLATKRGHIEVALALVERMTLEALMAQDELEFTALHLAAEDGHLEIVQVLVDRLSQEELMTLDVFEDTALHLAAFFGHLEIVQVLLDRMPPEVLLAQGKWQRTALHNAAFMGHLKIVQVLCNRMPQEALTIKEEGQKTALQYAQDRGHSNVVDFLGNKMTLKQR